MNAIRQLIRQTTARLPGLAATPERPQTLCLWFPASIELEEALKPGMRVPGVTMQVQAGRRAAALTVAARHLDALVLGLGDRLGSEVARQVKALVVEGAAGVRTADPARLTDLGALVGARRAGWIDALIAEERITCHFQPIVRAEDPTVLFGHEALMRGIDREGRCLPPAAIFADARESRRLFPLDRLARMAALRQSRRLGITEALFVNFSPAAIGEGRRYLEATTELVDELGWRREAITFEITETDRIEDLGAFRRVLGWYRDEGFQLALDDVGSGYSSLQLIDQLRPDFVKIDMGLVRQVHQDPFRAAITAKLLELARGLGITTVAEGIEQVGEWRWLRDHGADLVQGYLFGRPAAMPRVAYAAGASFAVVEAASPAPEAPGEAPPPEPRS